MHLAFNIFQGNPLLFIAVFVSCLFFLALVLNLLRRKITLKQIFKSSATWIMVGTFIVFVGSVRLITSLSAWSQNRQVLSETAETPAEIISHESVTRTRYNGSVPERSYLIKYRYTVNGRVYEREFETSAEGKYSLIIYAPPDKLKACYNPANPAESHLWEDKFKCGSPPDW